MERIAIFAALRWECRPILRHLRRVRRTRLAACTVWRGEAAGEEIWLVKTAIGEQRAAAAIAALGEGQFNLFFSTGCAGALAPELRPGDLAIATAVVTDSSAIQYSTDPVQRERARRIAERAALSAVLGPVLCSGKALASADAKRRAAIRTGAVAVEMEGAAIGACALRAGVPFLSVRAVLDTAATALPESGDLVDPQTGAVKLLALVRHLAAQPRAVAELLALQRMMGAAQRTLDRFFAAWLAG